jgi:DNA repair protein RecN (Recombination protein N)
VLAELYIKNFAIIDELRVGLTDGLNVLTGETGAGKSIIVDALGAALGQRIGSEVVRTGSEQALVEAVFDLSRSGQGEPNGSPLSSLLTEHGLEPEDGLLILSREINRTSGRTAARVNGRPVPLSIVQRMGELLVDIHGQSEHLSLLRVREHVGYLDRFAGIMPVRDEVSRAVGELRSVRNELEQLAKDERESAREIDLLKYQIQEIRAARLKAGEEEQLQADRLRLRNAERLMDLSHSIHQLVAGAEDQPGAADLLAQADKLYHELTRLDPAMESDRQALETARYAVEEAAERARDYAESVEEDPNRLEEVEERLELISELKRKYGGTVGEILRYLEEAEVRLERLSNRAFYQDELKQKEEALVTSAGALVSRLSSDRRAAAERLAEEVQQELSQLNMKGTTFQVAFSVVSDSRGLPYTMSGASGDQPTTVAFDSTGVDRVEFLVSPNPGEEAKPLARTASGGEMARLMLALKTILSKADAIPTLVFDEIDVGVGARSGTRVGEKLWRLTETHQVLCITHMPQIASMADSHLSVAKIVDRGRTHTAVTSLEGEPRVAELAAMLAGSTESVSALASARELLDKAGEYKGCKK